MKEKVAKERVILPPQSFVAVKKGVRLRMNFYDSTENEKCQKV